MMIDKIHGKEGGKGKENFVEKKQKRLFYYSVLPRYLIY